MSLIAGATHGGLALLSGHSPRMLVVAPVGFMGIKHVGVDIPSHDSRWHLAAIIDLHYTCGALSQEKSLGCCFDTALPAGPGIPLLCNPILASDSIAHRVLGQPWLFSTPFACLFTA